jgi:hypothetical protein
MTDLTGGRPMVRIMAIMARRRPYALTFARAVVGHLASIDARYDRLIREAMEEPLRYEPGVDTTNRKPLRQPAPFAAEWEIRFGPDNRFRALYDIDEPARTVQVLAVGIKDGNRLIVGGEEVES